MTQVMYGTINVILYMFVKEVVWCIYTVSLLGVCACLRIQIRHSFLVYCRCGNVF